MFNSIKNLFKYHLRSGKLFRKYLEECRQREKYSEGELREYQDEKLKKTIINAFENIPYYRKIFKDRKLTPKDINTIEDLKKLPYIDKQTVRENFKDLKNRRFKGLYFKGYTSGSSGTPGIFLRDLKSINYQNAFLWRQYQWAGKEFNSKRVTLRGEALLSIDKRSIPYWKYNKFSNELIMSSYHMSDENLKHYVKEINNYKPFDLYAFPSTAYILANFCKRFDLKINFKSVFTDAETLLDYQREEIESVFGCKLLDQYGSAERIVNISQCEFGSYHEMTDYSIVEYIPAGNGKYDVVGTSLFNTVMPLIRYKIGDLIELSDNNKCQCDRNFRKISRVYGRNDDYIILKDGGKLGRLSNIFKGLNFVKEAQIIQHSLSEIEIKIVPIDIFTKKNEFILLNRLIKYIGKEYNYNIQTEERIDRGKGGKHRVVVNNMRK